MNTISPSVPYRSTATILSTLDTRTSRAVPRAHRHGSSGATATGEETQRGNADQPSLEPDQPTPSALPRSSNTPRLSRNASLASATRLVRSPVSHGTASISAR